MNRTLKRKKRRNLNNEYGVNLRQDELSPGLNPNLGSSPLDRGSEEEHLLNDQGDENQLRNEKGPKFVWKIR
ncbi:hypothetical protein FQV26_12535 [Planococcus sp. CPCC 101016]|uniref:hypothetical protein n=1 Tax=Planococcus sp. CPCC 101016 TaxID=2599617 RepID=UPI0011B5A846|nr:hypothetical protein [Planococcus sp. CPCC 101016]TWT05269.1 hypothetical protein FQV26_12535 [Planococcus sp. CPCC 101016]